MSSRPVIFNSPFLSLLSSISSDSVISIFYGLLSLSVDRLSKFDSFLCASPPKMIPPATDEGEIEEALDDGLVDILSKYEGALIC
jgi:hypothetical protein